MSIMKALMMVMFVWFLALFSAQPVFAADPWFSDSFEGPAPDGWKDQWALNWDEETIVNNEAEGIPPSPGGGAQSFRQWWDGNNKIGGWSTAGGLSLYFSAVSAMPNKIGRLEDGAPVDEFVVSYYTYYHPEFDWGSSSGFKQIIARNEFGSQELYIVMHYSSGAYWMFFQHTTDTSVIYSNVNGPQFSMPKGEWVHFKWQIKVSPQKIPDGSGGWKDNPNIDGTVKGWVNGELRWDYKDIATIERGNYTDLSLNPTFNNRIDGPNQRRYWDQFSIGPVGDDSDTLAPGAPTNLKVQ